MSIVTRGYLPGDKEKIVELCKKVQDIDLDGGGWDWLFLNHPLKHQLIRLAEDSSKSLLVGQCALSPISVRVDDKVVAGALGVHLMVDSNYRKLGLFTRMGMELFEDECREKGFRLLYALPNENSYRGFVKLGWVYAGDVPILIRPLSFLKTARKYKPNWARNPLVAFGLRATEVIYRFIYPVRKPPADVTPVERFDAAFDRLFETFRNRSPRFLIHKNAGYMNWRYLTPKHINYKAFKIEQDRELKGILVLSRNDIRGAVVDLICVDEETENRLIDFAISYFQRDGADYILTMAPRNSRLHRKFKRFGFLTARVFPFVIRRWDDPDESVIDVSQWHLMPGDNDTF